jgi:hypothetical protein
MTAPSSIDPTRFLHEQLGSASPDLLRQMLTTFMNTLMSAEADAVCGAPYGESSPERTNVRNGYRHREFDTRAGTLHVAIPKLREGSYFPDWLLERRRRAERADHGGGDLLPAQGVDPADGEVSRGSAPRFVTREGRCDQVDRWHLGASRTWRRGRARTCWRCRSTR